MNVPETTDGNGLAYTLSGCPGPMCPPFRWRSPPNMAPATNHKALDSLICRHLKLANNVGHFKRKSLNSREFEVVAILGDKGHIVIV